MADHSPVSPRPTQPPTLNGIGNEYKLSSSGVGCILAGNVIVGLASQAPFVTDCGIYSPKGLKAYDVEMSSRLCPSEGWLFFLPYHVDWWTSLSVGLLQVCLVAVCS